MLAQKHPRGTKVFMIGENGIRVALEEKGFEVVGVEDAPQAEAVVMGVIPIRQNGLSATARRTVSGDSVPRSFRPSN